MLAPDCPPERRRPELAAYEHAARIDFPIVVKELADLLGPKLVAWLTQEISRHVYERTSPSGQRVFDGVSYLSRLGDGFRNWAILEAVGDAEEHPVASHDAASAIEVDDPRQV